MENCIGIESTHLTPIDTIAQTPLPPECPLQQGTRSTRSNYHPRLPVEKENTDHCGRMRSLKASEHPNELARIE